MFHCAFALNDQPMSRLCLGAHEFPAFSGSGEQANRRSAACLRGLGPIPPGTYYIFDRQSGGMLGPIRDLLTGRDDWFALYAVDGRIDDETFCNELARGNFRLHPKGRLGRSEGCIVVEREQDYILLRSILRSAQPQEVQGGQLKAYGTLVVR
ncbi:DUF2778 domain-containing protein [Aromatoleum evansii]|uniref:DUF2778 domain-containing protein n=1 Tax=Aromatoleum evansii TaxID=59406 RepID=A0ABZ1ARC2_AROEV|nr:DUF2778 domain-containing protein [Aromatoleum evansii]